MVYMKRKDKALNLTELTFLALYDKKSYYHIVKIINKGQYDLAIDEMQKIVDDNGENI